MDLRLVVGGLLARNAALSTLLVNYADRLQGWCPGPGRATAPCFIVPTWSDDPVAHAGPGSLVLTVEAHTSGSDRRHAEDLDSILRLVHVVLTDEHAHACVTARRLGTPAGPMSSDLDTVLRTASWSVTPVASSDRRATQRRLVPWPDCSTSVMSARALARGTVSMN